MASNAGVSNLQASRERGFILTKLLTLRSLHPNLVPQYPPILASDLVQMLRPWKVNLSINIAQGSRTAVYVQISQAITEQIRNGRLAPGDVLPGTRDLAEEIGVNRKTIIAAFDELVAQGWLTSDGTRGTFVSAKLPVVPIKSRERSPRLVAGSADSPDYKLVAAPPNLTVLLPQAGVLIFDDGAPDTRLFPVESLAREYRTAVLRSARRNALGYGDPRGSATLRRALSAHAEHRPRPFDNSRQHLSD